MNELNELLQWCIDNKAWLTFNYSPFDGGYKVFVNPGRTMTSAKWYKDLDEAVKACWKALGVNPDPMPKALVSLEEMRDAFLEVMQPIKRRGRPKGSKNRPKAVAE